MTRIQVGIDSVNVTEVAGSIERFGSRYVQRVFTEQEAAYCLAASAGVAAERFAVRFAAKEATIKALQLDTPSANWRSIEVQRRPSGACDVVLHGETAAFATRQGVESLALSMSHHADHATAVVIAQLSARASYEVS